MKERWMIDKSKEEVYIKYFNLKVSIQGKNIEALKKIEEILNNNAITCTVRIGGGKG